MKNILKITAIATAALTIPVTASAQSYNAGQYSPHQKCKKKENKKQIIGGLLGAVAGGVLGSQVSGNGARSEGSAIGAVVGGLAGAGIADKTIDCDPVYPTSSYGSERYESSGYGHTSGYSSGGYASQNQYQDQITVSNHPVYADPTYGATYGSGAVSQGTTYNAGTVTYPTQTYSQGYSQGYTTAYQPAPVVRPAQRVYQASHSQTSYSQPTYSQPTYSQPSYSQNSYSAPSYRNYGATHSSGYITRDPHYRPKSVGGVRHYHGSYACSGLH